MHFLAAQMGFLKKFKDLLNLGLFRCRIAWPWRAFTWCMAMGLIHWGCVPGGRSRGRDVWWLGDKGGSKWRRLYFWTRLGLEMWLKGGERFDHGVLSYFGYSDTISPWLWHILVTTIQLTIFTHILYLSGLNTMDGANIEQRTISLASKPRSQTKDCGRIFIWIQPTRSQSNHSLYIICNCDINFSIVLTSE